MAQLRNTFATCCRCILRLGPCVLRTNACSQLRALLLFMVIERSLLLLQICGTVYLLNSVIANQLTASKRNWRLICLNMLMQPKNWFIDCTSKCIHVYFVFSRFNACIYTFCTMYSTRLLCFCKYFMFCTVFMRLGIGCLDRWRFINVC